MDKFDNLMQRIMESMSVGNQISDLLMELNDTDQVKCVLCSAIDVWCANKKGYSLADSPVIVEDMLEMMKEVRKNRE